MIKNKTRVFIDCHSFDYEFQGVQSFLREIYNAFLFQYNDIELFFGASDIENIRMNFPLAKEENIIRYKHARPGFLRYVTDIPSIIKKYEIDFAHFQYIVPPPVKSCIYIVTLHDVLFEDFPADFPWYYRVLRRYLFKNSFCKAAIKTTVSSYSKERIALHYGVSKKEINIVPNGINASFTKNFKTKAEAASIIKAKYGIENFILYVSRIEPRKNHLLMLKTYVELELYNKNIPLVFIGKESIKVRELTTTLAQLAPSVKSMIYWFPQVSQSDLVAFYHSCKTFIFPSKAEGFGIPALEAAVCKVPVLCSEATAMSDFCFFKPYSFNPDDQKEFQEKLEVIVSQPPDELLLESIAKAVEHHYAPQQSAEIVYNLIKEHF